MSTLTFVTGNANKLKEVKAILSSGAAVDLTNQEVDVPEIQGTTQEIATYKCKAAAQIIKSPCITEDTALCFDSLNGLPGPYIKDFLKDLGHEGLNNLLAAYENKSATALCTFAYCATPESEPILFEGRTRGKIVPARGPGRFGWDPIFEVEGLGQTFAEMDPVEKNKISHRYKALTQLREFLAKQQA